MTSACLLAVMLAFVRPALAYEHDSVAVAADALVARPVCLVATIVGSAIFVIALPVAATSGSIGPTADTLVGMPAWATFKRPLGDFDFPTDYALKHPGKHERHRLAHHKHKAEPKTAKR